HCEPPPVLYHYTTQHGLLGILKADALWAAKVHFLNDSSEYAHALNLATEILKGRIDCEKNEHQRKRLECLLEIIPRFTRLNVCAASFCERGDLLSQWRAYGGTDGGYSLGFSSSRLREEAMQQQFVLVKCVYDDQEQRRLVSDVIQEALDTEFNIKDEDVDPKRPQTSVVLPKGGNFGVHLTRVAPLLKNKSFQEEQEWRLVSRAQMAAHMKFRSGRSTLVPFFEFKLGKKDPPWLQSVTIGPRPDMDLAKDAVRMLLVHWGMHKHVRAECSEVPYRNW
ncbi:MAG TPA: DUF2971 domain-containing protein, partial [Bryobacteraceae bacterium]|nr:DUF2971 domain-containing protein [Bryobacteraceae bacterium]